MAVISWPTFLIGAASQLLVAAFVAVITVRLALRRFQSEKWWEKKYDAYTGVIAALHKLRKSFTDDLNLAVEGRERSREQITKSKSLYQRGSDEIAHYSDLSDFLLSPESCEIIKKFGRDIIEASQSKTYEEFLDESAHTVNVALAALKSAAKRDLGVGPFLHIDFKEVFALRRSGKASQNP